MTDRVHPTARPATNGTAAPTATATAASTANGRANPALPTNKPHSYNPTRPAYRRQPPPRRRRSCCCSCCLWTTFAVVILLLLVAIAGTVFWVIYRPQRPKFSVSNLQLSQLNATTTTVISKLNVTITARNPNGKIKFYYDPISVSISSNDVEIGVGIFRRFEQGTKNTTALRTVLSSSGQTVEGSDLSTLRSELRNKKSIPLKLQLDTKVKAKIGSMKTKKIPIRVTCEGMQVAVPTGKTAATAKTAGVKCKVDPRIKILNWTF